MNIDIPSYTDTIILAVLQGVTEFLPISSSSFLVVYAQVALQGKHFLHLDIILHFATLCAVLFATHKTFFTFFHSIKKDTLKARHFISLIVYATLPILMLGFILYIERAFLESVRTISIIGITAIVFGIFLIIADANKGKKKKETLSKREFLFIGLGQALSLIPGVSRSGIIITMLRQYGISRRESVEVALFLSVPVIFFSTLLVAKDITLYTLFSYQVIVGFIVAFSTILLTICVLRRYIEHIGFAIFGYIRILLGSALLVYAYMFLS